MSLKFRNNIIVNNSGKIQSPSFSGKYTIIMTDVENTDSTTNPDPFVYYVTNDDYFLNIKQNSDTSEGTAVEIIFPKEYENEGRFIWIWDGHNQNASNKNISVYNVTKEVLVGELNADSLVSLFICSGQRWWQAFTYVLETTS